MSIAPHTMTLRRRTRVRIALGWLLAGFMLLLLTPLEAWIPLLGWAPMLTLVVSPLLIVLALDPWIPLRVMAVCMRRSSRRPRTRCWNDT